MRGYKYYASGIEITPKKYETILRGETDKLIRCPDNQEGIPLCYTTDSFDVNDGKLTNTDPLLKEVLKEVNLPLEQTFIVQWLKTGKTAIYGYW